MKRAILALLATVAGLMFIFSFRPTTVTADPLTEIVTPDPSDAPAKKLPLAKNPKGKVPAYEFGGQGLDLAGMADGSYAGEVVEIVGGHGPLQVTITVSRGEVVDIESAHEPTSVHSRQIGGRALPLLREEVLTTQQVPVDAVSGATAVSQAFTESLLSAAG